MYLSDVCKTPQIVVVLYQRKAKKSRREFNPELPEGSPGRKAALQIGILPH